MIESGERDQLAVAGYRIVEDLSWSMFQDRKVRVDSLAVLPYHQVMNQSVRELLRCHLTLWLFSRWVNEQSVQLSIESENALQTMYLINSKTTRYWPHTNLCFFFDRLF